MPPSSRRERARGRVPASALALIAILGTAAGAHAQAADSLPDTTSRRAAPFPRVPILNGARQSHTWAYVTIGSGAALVGASFLLARRANDTYDAYLRETDEGQIERLFDRTVLFDRAASGSLLGGEALICAGLYMRFLRRPSTARVGVTLEARRCAVSYRF